MHRTRCRSPRVSIAPISKSSPDIYIYNVRVYTCPQFFFLFSAFPFPTLLAILARNGSRNKNGQVKIYGYGHAVLCILRVHVFTTVTECASKLCFLFETVAILVSDNCIFFLPMPEAIFRGYFYIERTTCFHTETRFNL